MFILTKMQSVIRLEPRQFDRDLNEALSDRLNDKMANKVIKDVGLVISLWDIEDIGKSYIFPGGEGSTHTKVTFRLLVFRPFMEEVLVGKIRCCTKEGVHVSLGFFDDIILPSEALQHPHRFDETDQVWVWEYPTEDDDGNPSHHDLFMDPGEEIRFRVTSETFIDTSPTAPDPKTVDQEAIIAAGDKKIPYQLTASINEPGLGLLNWWKSDS